MTNTVETERTEDFRSLYANSVLYEASAWDLKLIFGQLDQASGRAIVKQNVAVTIPWPQAKLALFWLRFQVEIAEATVGTKIPIRKDLLPIEAPPLTPEEESDPATKQAREIYMRLREEFLATT